MNRLRPLTIGIAIVMTAGCAAKRDRYEVPAIPVPAQFKRNLSPPAARAPERQANEEAAKPEALAEAQLAQWWRILASRELDALVDRAIANNADLRIATLRIVQAKARADQAVADELPVVSAPFQAKAEAPKDGVGSVPPGGDVESRRTYQLSLRGDWRADIWGERRAMAESAELQLWRSTYQRDDTRRTLIASAVSLYVEYLSLNDRVRVARETETVLRGMLDSVRERMEVGDATATELEQQRAAVHAVRATIPALELQRENVANALAQLLGVAPASLALSERGLDSLSFPGALPAVPANLLLRRPDVRVVEARLLAADADIDVARTRLLPPLDLTAQVGYGSLVFSRLFQPYNLFWSAIANLSATIFDHGKRANEVAFARAFHEELVETYVRVLYGAIRETEDAIASVQMNGKRLEAQQAATDASRRAWELSMEAYGAGAIDYLTLLDTERTYHRNLDELYRIRMERLKGLANLFGALGGGLPQGGALPGAGPRAQGEAAGGMPGPQAAGKPVSPWYEPGPGDDEDYWLVEIIGLHDRAGIAHAWRDLNQRFPQLMAGRMLLPRLQGRVASGEQERAAWYRLFVAHFPTPEAAESFCGELTAQLQRCRVVSSRAEAFREFLAEPLRQGNPAPEPAPVPGRTQAIPAASADNKGDAPSPPPSALAAESPPATSTPVVETPLPQLKPVPGAAPAAQLGYAVQLDTLPTRADADAAAAAWARKGYETYVYPVRAGQGRIKFTVRSGTYANHGQAAREAKAVRGREKIYAVPVPIVLDAAGRPAPSAQ